MKKWMKLTAAAVAATALLYGCGGNGGGEKKTDDGKKQIAVVQVMQHGSLDAANQGFLDGLKERGYGADKISVDQQNAQGDQSNLKTIASRFKANRPDLICAISTPAAQAVANEIHDLPIIGCAITDFEMAKLVKSNSRPETNVTGVNDRGPVEKQVDMGLKFLPAAKRLGLIYSSSEVNSQIQADQAKAHAASLGLTVVERTVSSVNDIQQAAESMVGQVDFIYVPTDNVIASSIPTLVKVTDPAKIPVFVGADSMAKDGALAAISVDYYTLGKQTGRLAADILDGKVTAEKAPVEHQTEYTMIINEKSRENLGIQISEELMKSAAKV
mgnify:CR=1 FL=1